MPVIEFRPPKEHDRVERCCPVCRGIVEPTRPGAEGRPNVRTHYDSTNLNICPMSGHLFELTEAYRRPSSLWRRSARRRVA